MATVAGRTSTPSGNQQTAISTTITRARCKWISHWPVLIATLTEQPAITKILDAVGLPSHPPLPEARAPDPQLQIDPVMSVA